MGPLASSITPGRTCNRILPETTGFPFLSIAIGTSGSSSRISMHLTALRVELIARWGIPFPIFHEAGHCNLKSP